MKRKKRMNGPTRGQQLLVVSVVAILVIAALAGTMVFLYRPAGDGQELPFSTDTSPTTGDPGQSGTPPTGDTLPVTDQGGESEGPIYVAREEVYNFLLIGHDRVATLADVIMLVHYDVPAGKVAIMQLPRDTYFSGDSNKPSLNVQFSAYYNRAFLSGEKNPAAIAAEKFTQALEQNLCINIHYTAVMTLDGFADIVNAIDGVDLYIPYDMDYEDPEQDLIIHFKEGQTHLDGKDAEKFVRFRDGFVQADIGRGNAQKMFIAAFIEKAKSTISLKKLPQLNDLVTKVLDNLTTDLPLADAVYFAKNAIGVDLSNITMLTIPGDSVGSYYVMNRSATLAAINAHFNVYDNDIIPAIFDKSRAFTSATSTAIADAYYAENAALVNEFNAQNIRNNPIKIPMYPED